MATALTGAVITNHRGDGSFDWEEKCEKCGAIQPTSHSHARQQPGTTLHTSGRCYKCRQPFDIRIRG